MNYIIDRCSRIPAYLQLYDFLRKDITSGIYPYGTKLPSKRIIASETEVSIITAEHAIELLCDEGYIEARPRSGYFVIFRSEDFQVAQTPLPVYSEENMESHVVGDFPHTVLSKTIRKVLLDYEDKLLEKSPNIGCLELRREICEYLMRSRSIHVTPEQIVIGSGAEYLYGLIAQMFGKDYVFAIENPCYSKISSVYESFGVQYRKLNLKSDGIDSTELKKTDAIVLHTTPFNSFPSGITADVSKKHEYLNWAKKREGIIIEDNYDSELTVSHKQEDSLFMLSNGNNVIYLNTFSKTIAPSIRIGYMVLPESLVDFYNSRLGFYSCTVPVFSQYVLATLLRSGDFERHINRIRRKKRKEMREE